MKRLLWLAVLVCLAMPGTGWAEKEGEAKEKSARPDVGFDKAKARKVEDLKALLACIEAAQSREGMKNCREQISRKREMQEKQQKLSRIQEQKKKLEEQEKKLQGRATGSGN